MKLRMSAADSGESYFRPCLMDMDFKSLRAGGGREDGQRISDGERLHEPTSCTLHLASRALNQ